MESGISVLIVEDEFLTLNSIKESLTEVGYRIAGMAKSAKEAIHVLETKQVDIAILDINIQGDKDGLWLANYINENHKLPFVFLTAYNDEETVKSAVGTQPYGYLIKPFNTIDIYASIELALKNFEKANQNQNGLTVKSNIKNTPIKIDDHLFLKESHLYSRIRIKDVLYVKAEQKHVILSTTMKKYTLRHTFLEILEILPKDHFIQTHRSYLVNTKEVEHFGANFLIINGVEIPISNKRKENVLKAFKFL